MNMLKVFTDDAQDRVKKIHQLSCRLNGGQGKIHEDKLLSLMRKHMEEVEDLRTAGDSHYLIETGDLLILCLEILLENGKSIDEVTYQCLGRYEKKIRELLDK